MKMTRLLSLSLLCSYLLLTPSEALDYDYGVDFRLRYESWQNGDVYPSANVWQHEIDDDYVLSRIAVHGNVDFSENTKVFAEVEYADIHESKYITHRTYEKDPHFHLLYLQHNLDEVEIRFGRQTLDYGSRLVIGTNRFINNWKSYDVARVDYLAEKYEVSFFGGREAFEDFRISQEPHNPLGGYYFSKHWESWHADQYVLYKKTSPDIDVGYVGARVAYEGPEIEADLEVVKQVGERKGYASHGSLVWYLAPEHWSFPKLYLSYNLASGSEKIEKTYTPFASTGHLDRQSSLLVSYINLREFGGGIKASPWEGKPLSARLSLYDVYKDDKKGGIYSGGELVWAGATQTRHLGQYASLLLEYNIEETNTYISTCLSRFFLGSAARGLPNTADTGFFYLSLDQSF